MSKQGWQHTWVELATVCHPTLNMDVVSGAVDWNMGRAALLNAPWSDECPIIHRDTAGRVDVGYPDSSVESWSDEWNQRITPL
jgi:hypothetical protein